MPPDITLAQWYRESEPLLHQAPTQTRTRVVAVALLPVFKSHPDSWEAFDWLDLDTRGTFGEYMKDWHARVPERHRRFVRRILREFGVEISGGAVERRGHDHRGTPPGWNRAEGFSVMFFEMTEGEVGHRPENTA